MLLLALKIIVVGRNEIKTACNAISRKKAKKNGWKTEAKQVENMPNAHTLCICAQCIGNHMKNSAKDE